MAKVYTVKLGGKEWPLKYSARDAIELKRRFNKPLALLLRQDVMGLEERPKPNGKPGETTWTPAGTYDLEVQAAFVWVGLRNDKGQPTEAKVLEWIDAHLEAEENLGPIIEPVWRAVFVSGITGVSVDFEKVDEETPAEGKA